MPVNSSYLHIYAMGLQWDGMLGRHAAVVWQRMMLDTIKSPQASDCHALSMTGRIALQQLVATVQ